MMATTAPAPTHSDDELVRAVSPTVTRVALLVALHLLAVGHDAPGGGFVAGLVAGGGSAALLLGTGALPRGMSHPSRLLAGGLGLVLLTVLVPTVFGHPIADMGITTLSLGVLGTFKVTGALFFDVGVTLLVVGVVVAVLEGLRARVRS